MSQSLYQRALEQAEAVLSFLAQENAALQARNTMAVQLGIVQKEMLQQGFETVLGQIRALPESARQDPKLQPLRVALKQRLIEYNELARRNLILLQAAQSAAGMLLEAFRVALTPPALHTYGASGQVEENDTFTPPLVATSA